jgi:hypothetical protein
MSASSAYLTAVVAGAMTAGIGAANVLAVPPDTALSPQSRVSDVDLAAVITIPVIDIGPTPGPLSIWRYLAIQAGTNPLLLGLLQRGGNTYDLPGLTTTVDSTTNWFVKAVQGANDVDFGAQADQTRSAAYDVLGILNSSAEQSSLRNIHFVPSFGGASGIGAGLNGLLGQTDVERSLSLFDSGFTSTGHRTVGAFDSELSVLPFDGFVAAGDATVVDANPNFDFNLGSLTGSAGGHGRLSGEVGLCGGSGTGGMRCDGRTAFLTVGAPVESHLTLGGNNIISTDFSTNEVATQLKDGQFSVKGAVGGTITIGNLSIGRPIPIDIEIPRSSSMLSSKQSPTVKTSFLAVPGESGSGNKTATTGRHAARDAVNSAISEVRTAVKTAVNNVTNSKPKHAAPDSDD